jgi:hypothetical protein
MENQEIANLTPNEIEKAIRCYNSMKKSSEKYNKKNREILNEKARLKYNKNSQDPEYMKKKSESSLKSYRKKKESLKI